MCIDISMFLAVKLADCLGIDSALSFWPQTRPRQWTPDTLASILVLLLKLGFNLGLHFWSCLTTVLIMSVQ